MYSSSQQLFESAQHKFMLLCAGVWAAALFAWRYVAFIVGGTVVAIVDLFTLYTQRDGHHYALQTSKRSSASDHYVQQQSTTVVCFAPNSTRAARFDITNGRFVVRDALRSELMFCDGHRRPPVAVVTGGTIGGIGYSTCVHLMLAGVDVIAVCKTAAEGEACVRRALLDVSSLAQYTKSTSSRRPGSISCATTDLSDAAAVKRLGLRLVHNEPQLRMLVCNAGYMAPPAQLSALGHEMQMATHVVGHGVLIQTILNERQRAGATTPLRIVIVASAAAVGGKIPHTIPTYTSLGELEATYDRFQCYRDAKLCNVAMCHAWSRRLRRAANSAVTINSLHPGPIWSQVVSNSKLPIPQLLDWSISSRVFRMSPHAAGLYVSDLCLHRDYDNVSGHYFRMGVDMTARGGTSSSLWSAGTPSPPESCDDEKSESLLRCIDDIWQRVG